MELSILDPYRPEQDFPPLNHALPEPNGLLAIGGCLSPIRIVNAYQQGVFPWFNPGEPILWWSPDPRMVLFPNRLKISRSLAKTLRKHSLDIRYDTAFAAVIDACSGPRDGVSGTWITEEMKQAYCELHRLGVAHSVEAWADDSLVGGLYGLAIGSVFFGESMFHRQTDASKIALAHAAEDLQRWGFALIDCQVSNPHLQSLGAEEIARDQFVALLRQLCPQAVSDKAWRE